MDAHWFKEFLRELALTSLILPMFLGIAMGFFIYKTEKLSAEFRKQRDRLAKLLGSKKEF